MKTIYLVMLQNRETKEENILFAVDGTLHQAGNRMIEYVNANHIDTERYFLYLKKENCYCD